LHELKTRLKDLQAQLDEAVGEERYEEAATLRDQISDLEQQEKGLVTS
jgi:protein-arginine kinase activator protein McsA